MRTNSGSLMNGAACVQGLAGLAFSFNGGNQFLMVPNNPLLTPTGDFTLEGWVNLNFTPGQDLVILAGKRGQDSGLEYQMVLYTSPGTVFRSEISIAGRIVTVTGRTQVFPRLWYHWAMTYDGSSLKLYVNGLLDGTVPASGAISMTATPFVIGGVGGSWSLSGLVDEISLFSRALSQSELAAIYSAGSAGKCVAQVAPLIYDQPLSQTVIQGETALFNVTAGGATPIAFEWRKDNNLIPGATGNALRLTNVQPADAGQYSVKASNSAGFVLSSNATLVVVSAPPCTTMPSGLAGWWRGGGDSADAVAGNNGELINGVSFSEGSVGRAFWFNGINQFVRIADAPILNPASALTLEGWLNLDAWPGGDTIIIAAKRDPAWAVQYQMALVKTGNRWSLQPAIAVPGVLAVAVGSTGLQTQTWYHWAMTYDGSSLRAYLDGHLEASLPASGPIACTSAPFFIGGVGSWSFGGGIDEISIYSRALSETELQAIAGARPGGKCLGPVAPYLVSGPTNKMVAIGDKVLFSTIVSGTPPLYYQWSFNGTNIFEGTSDSLVLSDVQMRQAGLYSIVVTNSAGACVASANLMVKFPPAAVRVADTPGEGGRDFSVPILLKANGNESALGFSLTFSTTLLEFKVAAPGSANPAALIFANTNLLSWGQLGVVLSLAPGQVFSAGTQEVARIHFKAAEVTSPVSTVINISDAPTAPQLVDSFGNLLDAIYTAGTVSLEHTAFEADAWPRPGGDGVVSIADWVLVGRYAAGVDVPTDGREFRAADCAPRGSGGDGAITVADWVQAGRYASGLDALALAGGPDSQQRTPFQGGDFNRQLRVGDASWFQNETGAISLYLEAQGEENAVGATLQFDPAAMSLERADPGADAAGAAICFNASQANFGRLGFLVSLPTGAHFAAGRRELMRLTLRAGTSRAGESTLSLSAAPVFPEIVDATATPLGFNVLDGHVAVKTPPVLRIDFAQQLRLSWPDWATNFYLQEASPGRLSSSVWTNIAGSPDFTNGEQFLILPRGEGALYRLRRE